ncbi:MAG: hypothetical protein ACK53G_07385, partial [Armatimonadota bacterium]
VPPMVPEEVQPVGGMVTHVCVVSIGPMPVSRNVTATLGKILLASTEDDPVVSTASIRTLTN